MKIYTTEKYTQGQLEAAADESQGKYTATYRDIGTGAISRVFVFDSKAEYETWSSGKAEGKPLTPKQRDWLLGKDVELPQSEQDYLLGKKS